MVFVFLIPRSDIRKRATPIDTSISPEVDQNNFSVQPGTRHWLRVEPPTCTSERGKLAVDGQSKRRVLRSRDALDLCHYPDRRHRYAAKHRGQPEPPCFH